MGIPVQSIVARVCDLAGLNNAIGAPSPEDQALAVDVINDLLGEWSSKRYINPNLWSGTADPVDRSHIVMSADPNVTADVTTDLVFLDQVTAELGAVVYGMKKISLAEYMRLSVKQVTAIPRFWAYDYQLPTGNVWLWPQPVEGVLIRLVGLERIPKIVSQSEIDLDDMAASALKYNAAVLIYDYFPRDSGISQNLIYKAQSSLHGLKQRVMERQNGAVQSPLQRGGRSNYWQSPLNTVTH